MQSVADKRQSELPPFTIHRLSHLCLIANNSLLMVHVVLLDEYGLYLTVFTVINGIGSDALYAVSLALRINKLPRYCAPLCLVLLTVYSFLIHTEN